VDLHTAGVRCFRDRMVWARSGRILHQVKDAVAKKDADATRARRPDVK